MLYTYKPPLILPLISVLLIFSHARLSIAHNSEIDEIRGRTLMGFKETPDGGNQTFDCSPSGPCIPCYRSEKSDEKYRCGETGYRIRLKCVPSGPVSKDTKKAETETRKRRSTIEGRYLAGSAKSKGGSAAYVSYRSCIPAVSEEKLSVIGFESLMLALLVNSGSFIYFRRKRSGSTSSGAPARLPTSNARF